MSERAAPATLSRVPVEERAQLTAMLASYLSELGESPHYPYLDLYWTEKDRFPYLIRVAECVAGFALVRRLESGTTEISEFYVLENWRQRGVGHAAAAALFAAHPGPWMVRAFPGHAAAEAFWSKAVPSDAHRTRHEDAWVYSFRSREARRANMEIRPPHSAEMPAVSALLVANGWAHRVQDDAWLAKLVASSRAVVAIEEGEVVGFARAVTDGLSNGYLSMLVVAETRRRRGIGAHLVRHIMGVEPGITWVLRASRPGARAFFERLGFHPSSDAMERNRDRADPLPPRET